MVRMLIVGAIGFAAAELLYGSRGPDTGVLQFLLYGIVGMAPTMLSSWLAHKYADAPRAGSFDLSVALIRRCVGWVSEA